MQTSHGYVTRVTVSAVDINGDTSSQLNLDHDHKGRKLVRLPDRDTNCDPDLVGKSPDQIAQILADREGARDDDANFDFEREMQKVPGGRIPGSSSSGGSSKKPKPPTDHTKGSIQDLRDVSTGAELKPMTVSGKVSTRAYNALRSQPESTGNIFDRLGIALAAGVRLDDVYAALDALTAATRRERKAS